MCLCKSISPSAEDEGLPATIPRSSHPEIDRTEFGNQEIEIGIDEAGRGPVLGAYHSVETIRNSNSPRLIPPLQDPWCMAALTGQFQRGDNLQDLALMVSDSIDAACCLEDSNNGIH